MRVATIVVVIWLVIGVIAASERHYFSGSKVTCAKFGTVVLTAVAGPLNYLGVNPKVRCVVPQPSK